MNNQRNNLALLGVASLAVFVAPACSLSVNLGADVDGSGDARTETYEFADFDEIDIASAFNADITVVEGPHQVEVTLDDNLFEYLEIGVDNGELEVQMSRGNIGYDVEPTVVISLPDLTEIDASGASSVSVDGVDSSELKLDVSGASKLDLTGHADRMDLESSGASEVGITGSIGDLTIEVSGASSASLTDATVEIADVDLSGASNLEFGDVTRVAGEASGASSLEVPEGTSTSVSTSGSSSVEFD